jgi:hypothetical protein
MSSQRWVFLSFVLLLVFAIQAVICALKLLFGTLVIIHDLVPEEMVRPPGLESLTCISRVSANPLSSNRIVDRAGFMPLAVNFWVSGNP